VESRYGLVGDDHRSKMQRAFAGANKNLYGFDSIGPSGKSVKGFLQNYFSKIRPVERLQKLQADRMFKKVMGLNMELEKSLKQTAFTQCHEGSNDTENSKIICMLRSPKVSVEQKLETIREALTKENYLLFVPSINEFLSGDIRRNLTAKQEKILSSFKDNKIISSQIKNLIKHTESLSLAKDWTWFAENLGIISRDESEAELQKRIKLLIKKGLRRSDVDLICSRFEYMDKKLDLELKDLRSQELNALEVEALGCLGIANPEVANLFAASITSKDRTIALKALSVLTNTTIDNKADPEIVKSQLHLVLKDNEADTEITMAAFKTLNSRFRGSDVSFKKDYKKYFNHSDFSIKAAVLSKYLDTYDLKQDEQKEVEVVLKKMISDFPVTSLSDELNERKVEIINLIGDSNTTEPELVQVVVDGISDPDERIKDRSLSALADLKVGGEVIEKKIFAQLASLKAEDNLFHAHIQALVAVKINSPSVQLGVINYIVSGWEEQGDFSWAYEMLSKGLSDNKTLSTEVTSKVISVIDPNKPRLSELLLNILANKNLTSADRSHLLGLRGKNEKFDENLKRMKLE